MARFMPPLLRKTDSAMKIFAKGWSTSKDGPGHRRIYYLKGCDLRCLWCASPESINFKDDLLFYPARADENDLKFLCPVNAISGKILNRSICRNCTAQPCRSLRHRAMEWVGCEISVDDIVNDLLDAKNNWSGFSGVTFGGGEVSLQSRELLPLLKILRRHNIHSTIESNAHCISFPDLVRETDMVITDLKCGTADTFLRYTSGNFDSVRKNHRFAAEFARSLIIRVPLIPSVNDTRQEIKAMTAILHSLNHIRLDAVGETLQVEILKLHHFGAAKYAALDLPYQAADFPIPSDEALIRLENIFTETGLSVIRS